MAASGEPQLTAVGESVLAEHRQIRDLSHEIESTSDLLQLLSRLQHFRSVLVTHFLAEEAVGGFYDTLRSMAPRQIRMVYQLEHEHGALLADIDRVVERARACLAGPVAAVLAEAGAVVRRLQTHETAEDDVLLDTLYVDLGQGQ
jgi:hemerythrin-like domain-containing protein